MDAQELMGILNAVPCLRMWNNGVYSRDTVPSKMAPGAYIINTAPRGHPGMHWTAAWMREERTPAYDVIIQHVDFFDSLAGGAPSKRRIFFNVDTVLFNQRILQSPDTTSCGLFAIYFLFWESHGVALNEIVKHFSVDRTRNEQMVKDFVNSMVPFH